MTSAMLSATEAADFIYSGNYRPRLAAAMLLCCLKSEERCWVMFREGVIVNVLLFVRRDVFDEKRFSRVSNT